MQYKQFQFVDSTVIGRVSIPVGLFQYLIENM